MEGGGIPHLCAGAKKLEQTMKNGLVRKVKSVDGRRTVYFCGVKLFSYCAKRKHADRKAFVSIKGTNNRVSCVEEGNPHLRVLVCGNDNVVRIDAKGFTADVYIGAPDCPVSNCSVVVGENTTSNGVQIMLLENGSSVTIGKDCMFSAGIVMQGSDTHCIFDESGRLLNVGRSISIGDHVWCGRDVKIAKNSAVPDNCIVGMGSIVTKVFSEKNCIIAGVPAKVVKRGVNWSRQRPQSYLNENSME